MRCGAAARRRGGVPMAVIKKLVGHTTEASMFGESGWDITADSHDAPLSGDWEPDREDYDLSSEDVRRVREVLTRALGPRFPEFRHPGAASASAAVA